MKINSLVLLMLFLCLGMKAANKQEVLSPDGRNKVVFSLDKGGAPFYQVLRDGKALIAPSIMGFEAKNNLNLNNEFKVKGISFDAKDEIWTQPWGENKTMREHYNEMAVKLKIRKPN